MAVSYDVVECLGGRFLCAASGCTGNSHQRNGESGEGAPIPCGHSAPERTAALTWALRTLLRFIDS